MNQMSIIQNQTTNHNILTHTLFNFRHGLHNLLVLFFLFMQTTPPATAQPLPVAAPPGPADTKKSMAGVMAVVAILFFISGFLSLYTRNCAERRNRIRGRFDLSLPLGGSPVRSIREPRGLHSEVIESFPTFLYATVKGLRIAKETLACAVCLDEFKDDDTLRLIPKCNHVFHPCCIDLWLESHTTCPVCRANLVPRSEDVTPPFVAVHQFPDEQEHQPNDAVVDDDDVESPKGNLLHRCRTMNQNRTPRSRSTGFLFDVLFPRSNSTGHDSVVVGPGENCERFTLRLPEEVRSQLLKSTLKRTSSCVSFRRMSSGRKGYRTRSVGSGRGRNYLQCQHERFCNEERWGFTLTTPFFNRSSGAESTRKTTPVQCSAVASDHVFGEGSSDRLSPSQPG